MYILGASADEQKRLEKQAMLLSDEVLKNFCQRATSILDVGCGPGTLLPSIRAVNNDAIYTGFDLNDQSIAKAKEKFGADSKATFKAADVLTIDIEQKFDLVISRLFLWSVKKSIHLVLSKCKNAIADGGFFYSYEPNDRLLEYYPADAERDDFLAAWQDGSLKNGADPFIGRNVAAFLSEHGFANIKTEMHGVVVTGVNQDIYEEHAANLARIFLNPNHPYLQAMAKDKKESIEKALLSYDYRSVISQCYVITTGQKL